MTFLKSHMIMEHEQERMQNAVSQADIRAIKKEVEAVSGKVNDVHQALIGSPLGKDGGLVQRVVDCETELVDLQDKIEQLEKNSTKANLYLQIIYACGGVLLTGIASLLFNYFTKK